MRADVAETLNKKMLQDILVIQSETVDPTSGDGTLCAIVDPPTSCYGRPGGTLRPVDSTSGGGTLRATVDPTSGDATLRPVDPTSGGGTLRATVDPPCPVDPVDPTSDNATCPNPSSCRPVNPNSTLSVTNFLQQQACHIPHGFEIFPNHISTPPTRSNLVPTLRRNTQDHLQFTHPGRNFERDVRSLPAQCIYLHNVHVFITCTFVRLYAFHLLCRLTTTLLCNNDLNAL